MKRVAVESTEHEAVREEGVGELERADIGVL